MSLQVYAGLSNHRAAAQSVVTPDPELADGEARYAAPRMGQIGDESVSYRGGGSFNTPAFDSKYIQVSAGQSSLKGHSSLKRALDIFGASLAILCLLPLFVVILAGTYLSGGSPVFRHRRVGRGGQFFDCLKFRTMVTDADHVLQSLLQQNHQAKEEWLRDHKLRDDPRITRFGRFLRRTSLDELPQLWNVLRGEMSLVGPRPVVPDELKRYGKDVSLLLSARPGITGLWQISGRNNMDYRKRVALDLYYVRSQSVLFDFYIMVKTLRVVFNRHGAY